MPRKLKVSANTARSVCEITSVTRSLAVAVSRLETLEDFCHLRRPVCSEPRSPRMAWISTGMFESVEPISTICSGRNDASPARRRANAGVTRKRRARSTATSVRPPQTADAHGGMTNAAQPQGNSMSAPTCSRIVGRRWRIARGQRHQRCSVWPLPLNAAALHAAGASFFDTRLPHGGTGCIGSPPALLSTLAISRDQLGTVKKMSSFSHSRHATYH